MSQSASSLKKPALAEEDRARSGTYRLISTLLAGPPDGAVLERLRGIAVDAKDERAVVQAWAALRLAAERTRPEAVEDEFQTLFIGLGRGELVPYGSWYQTGFLMERPLADLRSVLERLGFRRQPGVSEPEDHAAALCGVMSALIDDGVDHATQREFFSDHIDSWMLRLFRDLQEADSAFFYRSVGALGETFMAIEQRYFAMLV